MRSLFTVSFAIVSMFAQVHTRVYADENTTEISTLTGELEQLQTQADAVSRFGMAKVDDVARNSIGLSRDNERMKQNLQIAKNHFALGDPERTIEIVKSEISRSKEFDLNEVNDAYKLLYESYRKLGRDTEAARLCNQVLSRAFEGKNKDRNTFDFNDEWSTSCALSFVKATQPMSKRIASISEDELEQFTLSPLFKERTKYTLPRAVLFASAYRNLARSQKALLAMQQALQPAKNDEPWLARAFVTLGLLHEELGDSKNALRYLRTVAGDLSTFKDELPRFKSDRYSSYLANVSLARVYSKLGQNEEAKNRYLAALSDKDVFLPSKGGQTEFLSENRFQNTSEENVRWELANAYDAIGKKEEASKQFSSLLKDKLNLDRSVRNLPLSRVDANALLYARSLNGDPSQSQAARDLLNRLYAFAETDVNYVAGVKKKNSNATLEQLETQSHALLLLANAHNVNVPEVQRLKLFQKVYDEGVEFVKIARRDLVDVLTPVDVASQGVLEARELAVLQRMGELQIELIEKIRALDEETLKFWRDEKSDGALKFASLNRKEMFRRFDAAHDDVQRLLTLRNSNQTERMHLKNQARIEYLQRELQDLRQTSLSNAYLAGDSKDARYESSEREISERQIELDNLMLEHRLYGFQAVDVWKELPQFKRQHLVVSRTLRELHNLHRRMLRDLSSVENKAAREALNLAWQGVLKAEVSIGRATLNAVQEMQSRRRQIVGRAQEIIRIADMEERGLAKLKTNMRTEFLAHLPKVAEKLEPVVTQFREEVRLAVVDDLGQRMKEGEQRLEDLQRARDERLQWLRSLKQSIDWGLAR